MGAGGDEWRKHWTMVLASMIGLSFATMAIYALGLFMDPLVREFGWTRVQVTSGFSAAPILMIPLAPLVGAMIDRWGSRRLAIPGIVLSSCAFACFSLANGSVRQWVLLWVVYAVLNASVNTTVWTTAVSGVFLKSRGMALAATLSGAALGQTIAPLVAQRLIDHYGWRSAFRWMGLSWGAVVLALILPFFFDAHDHRRRAGAQSLRTAAAAKLIAGGLTLREALRTRALVRIGLALFIATTLGVGLTVHKVPILTAAGLSRSSAATIAASAGLAGISGKLLTGWLLDRWQSGWIPGISVSLPALACLSLLEPIRTTPSIVLAMLILGYSSGAYLQVCTYLTSRHGGLRHFGKVFGVMAALMSLGSGLGPQLVGAVVDHFGNYTPVLIIGIPTAMIAGWLVGDLGPYPRWEEA